VLDAARARVAEQVVVAGQYCVDPRRREQRLVQLLQLRRIAVFAR